MAGFDAAIDEPRRSLGSPGTDVAVLKPAGMADLFALTAALRV
ncbi:hypothetical protein [Microbacterium sp. gxy059]